MLDEAPPLVLPGRWPPRSVAQLSLPGERAPSQGGAEPGRRWRASAGVIESARPADHADGGAGDRDGRAVDRGARFPGPHGRAEGSTCVADLERSLREISRHGALADLAHRPRRRPRPGWRGRRRRWPPTGARRGPAWYQEWRVWRSRGDVARSWRGCAAISPRPGRCWRGRSRGKPLDFLAQELLRRGHTICSKAASGGHGPGGGGLKAEIERFASRYRTLSDRVPTDRGLRAVRGRGRAPSWNASWPNLPGLRFSVSHTTRSPRPQERDGSTTTS